MKLSEAIKRGAKQRPKSRDAWFDGKGSCVWAAALEGIDRFPGENLHGYEGPLLKSLCEQEWPWAFRHVTVHPILGVQGGTQTVADIMFSLNDGFRSWSRERIADWVTKIEMEEQQVSGPWVEEKSLFREEVGV